MKLIAAVDSNWAIGYQNQLLARIPADMRFFRQETLGKVVLMGRNTLRSFPAGQPLKDRTNMVITRDPTFRTAGVTVLHSIEEALHAVADIPTDEVYVIGGGSIYRQLLPYCSTAYITKIAFAFQADVYLPNLDADDEWTLVSEGEEETYHDLEYVFCQYRRVKGGAVSGI